MKFSPRISGTEWEIMRVIWRQHPTTANEVMQQLPAADSSWHPKTARTLLLRHQPECRAWKSRCEGTQNKTTAFPLRDIADFRRFVMTLCYDLPFLEA